MKWHIGIVAAGGGYEISYVELGTLLPGMGQTIKMTERISDKTTTTLGQPKSNKSGEGEEGSKKEERGCGGATQVAIFHRKNIDIHRFHQYHNHEEQVTENNNAATVETPSLDMSSLELKGLGLGEEDVISGINDGCRLNDTHTHLPHSQSEFEPMTAAQTHLYWHWNLTTGSCSSSQRKDAQQPFLIRQQLGHTSTAAAAALEEKRRPCREDID